MPYIARKCQHLFCYLCITPTILLATKKQQQQQQHTSNQSQIHSNSNNNNNNSSSMYNFFQVQDTATSSIRSIDHYCDDVDDGRDYVNNNHASHSFTFSSSSHVTFRCPVCRVQQSITDCQPYYQQQPANNNNQHHHIHS